MEAFSVSHGKASAYLPVIELLHDYFGIASSDDHRTRREKIAGRESRFSTARSKTHCLIYSRLLGIAEDTIRSRRWTRKSGGGARSMRSSASCCARA